MCSPGGDFVPAGQNSALYPVFRSTQHRPTSFSSGVLAVLEDTVYFLSGYLFNRCARVLVKSRASRGENIMLCARCTITNHELPCGWFCGHLPQKMKKRPLPSLLPSLAAGWSGGGMRANEEHVQISHNQSFPGSLPLVHATHTHTRPNQRSKQ